jgi:hypothetical protein
VGIGAALFIALIAILFIYDGADWYGAKIHCRRT